MATGGIADFFRYQRWANEQMFIALDSLGDDALAAEGAGTFGSIRDMLVHVSASQANFLAAMTGTAPSGEITQGMQFPGLGIMRAHVAQADDALIAVADSRSPDQVLQGEFGGRAYKMPLVAPLMQSFSHGVEHRTQIATICGQHGFAFAPIDVWGWAKPFG